MTMMSSCTLVSIVPDSRRIFTVKRSRFNSRPRYFQRCSLHPETLPFSILQSGKGELKHTSYSRNVIRNRL